MTSPPPGAAATRTAPRTALRIEQLTSAIGAVVEGIDLASRLADAEVHDLRAAIHRHRVVFVRGQHLSLEEHRHLGQQLELNRLLEDPHVQVRWRWEAGDVAIWDEAATCHRALIDHFPQRRTMRRCVVQGDCPR